MLFQLADPPVDTPEVVWSALAPLVTLAVGAVLLIMFRSIVKRLPPELDAIMTTAIGPVTVLAMWIVGGLVGGLSGWTASAEILPGSNFVPHSGQR